MAQTIKLKRSATAGGAPTTSQLELGEVAINTYDGKMYIKKSVAGTESIVEISGGDSGTGIIDEFLYTATAGQTAFSGNDDNSDFLSYVIGAIQVFLNGILLDPETDYTATNGALITLVSAAAVNDYLQIFSFKKKISDGNVTVDSFSGNNSTTAFTLSIDPGDENNTRVFVDGVYQSKANYTVSGTTLTFSTAPPSGTAIEVESGNRSVTLPTTENLDFPDNVKLRLGTSQDLEIYHDASDSLINDNGTGSLKLQTGGSTKLEVTSTGVDVTGNIAVSGTVDGVDIAARDAVLTSTTTTAGAALPRTGGAMTGAITTNSTFDGRDVATDGSKLDGIEAGATADQTQSEINALGITATGLSGTPAISVANITTTGELRGPASFTIDPAAVGDNTGTVIIKGNLQVDGATTTINSTTLTVDDLNLTLASGAANGTAANGAGITIDGASATLTYNSTGDSWDFNKPLNVQTNLLISSSASNSIISESGSGGLFLRGSSISVQNSSNANMIQALSAGAVTLYHNGAPKIATSSSGASITGILNVTGNIAVSGTVDGVDIAARDAVLTSTTTTANAALPKAGGTMTGNLAINTGSPELYFGTTGNHYNWRIAAQELVDAGFEIAVGSQDTDYSNDTYVNKFVVKASGNVGIGNSAPLGKLTISNAAGTNAPSTVTAANTYLQLGSDDYGPSNNGKFMIGFGYTDATNTNSPAYIGYEEASTSGDTYGDLTFYTRSVTTDTAPTERMRIDSSGNVGIGVIPKTDWHTGYDAIQIGESSAFFGNSAGDEVFMVQNARYTSSGWKYNSSGTAALFDMQSGSTRWRRAASGSNDGTISWSDSMFIDSSGNVGIGTTAVTSPGLWYDANPGYLAISHWATPPTPAAMLHLSDNSNDLDVPQIRIEGRENAGDTKLDISVKDAAARFNLVEGPSADASAGFGQMIFKTNAAANAAYPARGGFLFSTPADANNLVITNTGKVGIGTAAPTSKLEVIVAQSDTMTDDTAAFAIKGNGGDGILMGQRVTTPYAAWIAAGYLPNIGTSHNYPLTLQPHGGNVGIGNINPQTNLTIGSAQGNSLEFTYDSSNGYRNIISNHWDSSTDTRMDFNIGRTGNVAPVPVMSVGYGGNVGIGTTTPAQKLEVAGDIRISDARSLFFKRHGDNYAWRVRNESASDGSTYGFNGDNKLVFEVVINSNLNASPSGTSHSVYASSTNTLVLTEQGRVGIGTDAPGANLDLRGDMRLDGSAGTDRSIYFRNQGTIGGQVKSDKNLSLWAGNGSGVATQYLTIKEGGNVGIGTDAPTAPLQLNTAGNTADGTYYSTFTINNTGSSTWSRLRFDRSGVAKWGVSLGTDDKFKISNLYTGGSAATPDDNALVIDNNSNVGIGFDSPLNALSVNGVITSGNFTSAGISGSIGDANTAEVGPGYINLARDDTADAAQIRFGKNGSVHSYLETRASGLGFVASAGHSFEGGLLAVGVSRAGLSTSNNRKLWVKGSAAFESQSGGTANPSLLTNTAIYLGPGSTRATSITNPGTMGYADAGTGLLSGGIAWDHLRNYQTYGVINYGERPHGWLGSELHSTPGYELSNMVMATREATANNSETKVAMRWNATGEITTPRNPAFHAYGTNMTSQSTEGNHGTWNEIHDRGANFTAGAGAQFTAPVDGIYAFYAQCNFNNSTIRPFYWRAVKNSADMGIFYSDIDSGTWTHTSAFITVVMDKNDTFEWRYKGDPDEGSNWCQQGGYLIG